jgi:hypothetical protein
MSRDSRDASRDANELQHDSERQNANTGEGSGSALAAMLKKRREGENHPDDEAGDGARPQNGRTK